MSVFKRPKAQVYSYDFWIKGSRFLGTFSTRNEKDAKALEKQLKAKARADIEAQEKTGKGPITLDLAAGEYWQEVGQHKRDHAGTKNALKLLIKHFGKTKRMDEITDADVAGLVAWRREHFVTTHRKKPDTRKNPPPPRKVSPSTVNRSVVEPLRKLFIWARTIRRYQFPHEPIWKHHRLKEPPERVRELHGSEEKALSTALRPDYEPWFRFASTTGLRLAETLLKWENVNWAAKSITTIGKGNRVITTPITDDVAEILKPLIGHHESSIFTYICRKPRKGQTRGKRYPLTYMGAKSEWQAMRKRSGVKGFRFHDVRHDMATKLLRETGNIKLVSKALNHSDMKTTSRYAHVMDDELSEALQNLSTQRKKSREMSRDKASETK